MKKLLASLILLSMVINILPADSSISDGVSVEYIPPAYRLGIGYISPASKLHVNGDTASKSFTFNGNTLSVPSLTQGDLLFAKENGKLKNLAKGTDHYALKVNGNKLAWESVGGGGGSGDSKVLISTQTASNSSAIVFTGIDGTYDRYEIELDNVKCSIDSYLRMQVSTYAGSSYETSSIYTYVLEATYSASGGSIGATTTYLNLSGSLESSGNKSTSGNIYLITPANTTLEHSMFGTFIFYHDIAPRLYTSRFAGYFNSTSAYNAVKFYMSTGNISVGTFRLYGLQ